LKILIWKDAPREVHLKDMYKQMEAVNKMGPLKQVMS